MPCPLSQNEMRDVTVEELAKVLEGGADVDLKAGVVSCMSLCVYVCVCVCLCVCCVYI